MRLAICDHRRLDFQSFAGPNQFPGQLFQLIAPANVKFRTGHRDNSRASRDGCLDPQQRAHGIRGRRLFWPNQAHDIHRGSHGIYLVGMRPLQAIGGRKPLNLFIQREHDVSALRHEDRHALDSLMQFITTQLPVAIRLLGRDLSRRDDGADRAHRLNPCRPVRTLRRWPAQHCRDEYPCCKRPYEHCQTGVATHA